MMVVERAEGWAYLAIQEYRYKGVLRFIIHVSRKPLPKNLSYWNDSAFVVLELGPNDGKLWPTETTTRSDLNSEEAALYWPFVLKWGFHNSIPCESWERGLIGFTRMKNRLRKQLGFVQFKEVEE